MVKGLFNYGMAALRFLWLLAHVHLLRRVWLSVQLWMAGSWRSLAPSLLLPALPGAVPAAIPPSLLPSVLQLQQQGWPSDPSRPPVLPPQLIPPRACMLSKGDYFKSAYFHLSWVQVNLLAGHSEPGTDWCGAEAASWTLMKGNASIWDVTMFTGSAG